MRDVRSPRRARCGAWDRTARAGAAALALALAAACGPSESPEPPAEAPPEPTATGGEAPAPAPAADESAEAMAAAREIFDTRCVTCHGPQGAGDGPGSAALDPKPRDFRDAEWQESVTDEHIQQAILYGGAAIGKSPAMPGNPDLMARPEVTAALVDVVRSLETP